MMKKIWKIMFLQLTCPESMRMNAPRSAAGMTMLMESTGANRVVTLPIEGRGDYNVSVSKDNYNAHSRDSLVSCPETPVTPFTGAIEISITVEDTTKNNLKKRKINFFSYNSMGFAQVNKGKFLAVQTKDSPAPQPQPQPHSHTDGTGIQIDSTPPHSSPTTSKEVVRHTIFVPYMYTLYLTHLYRASS